MNALKFVDGTDDQLEGLLMPYGGIFNGRDITGEYFSAKTDFALDWFDGDRPLLYHHGLDADVRLVPVGRIKSVALKADGGWMRAQLDRSSEYFDAIKELVAAGKLFLSSGSMSHLVRKAKSGEILTWPLVEGSLTPSPANLLATVDLADAEKHFDAAGVKAVFDGAKAKLTSRARRDLSKGSFAYVDSSGTGHLPIQDASHVRNALARFDQTSFESDEAKQAARRKIEAAARRFGIQTGDSGKSWVGTKALPTSPTPAREPNGDAPEGSYEDLIQDLGRLIRGAFTTADSYAYAYPVATFPEYCLAMVSDGEGESYYEIAYELDADGEPLLGETRQVELVYQPLAAPMVDEAPLAMQAARFAQVATLFDERTTGLAERRAREGRALSAGVRAHVSASAAVLKAALGDLERLLADPEPVAEAAAAPERDREIEILRLYAATVDPSA